MRIKYEPKSFQPRLLDTSCELLAKYEVIRAKALLKRNEKPQNSIILGLCEPKIDTSCELLAKYEVIRAKTLLNGNEKPQKLSC